MKNCRKILFLTGTRADYGKLKSLIKKVDESEDFEPYVFITGMHLLPEYGSTYMEVEKDGFKNIYKYENQKFSTSEQMDIILSDTIKGLSKYVNKLNPDLIVVHGDRLEALAGAIVSVFNNIRLMHIEGGEVTGSIDESIRHAISKFSHYHLVSNEEAKKRLIQLGEDKDNIYVFGSPDIDIMYSKNLPTLEEVKNRYEIPFENYKILMYHPVTTDVSSLDHNINEVVNAVLETNENYVVIYPNNDLGNQIILKTYEKFNENNKIRLFPSMRFEYFLTLLKNSELIVGNSSAGVREACVYGTPCIDIGNRQTGRYQKRDSIIHVNEDKEEILKAIKQMSSKRFEEESYFGEGNSNTYFIEILRNPEIWEKDIQKRFIDLD